MKAIFRDGLTLSQIQAAEYKNLSSICAVPKYLISGGRQDASPRVLRRFDSMDAMDKEFDILRVYYDKWTLQKLTAW